MEFANSLPAEEAQRATNTTKRWSIHLASVVDDALSQPSAPSTSPAPAKRKKPLTAPPSDNTASSSQEISP